MPIKKGRFSGSMSEFNGNANQAEMMSINSPEKIPTIPGYEVVSKGARFLLFPCLLSTTLPQE